MEGGRGSHGRHHIITCGCSLDDVEKLIFVVCDDAHYMPIVADVSKKTQNDRRRLIAYDSIKVYRWDITIFAAVLNASLCAAKVWTDARRKDASFPISRGKPAITFFKTTPQQDVDSNDCAIATLLCIQCLIAGKDLEYDAKAMTDARAKIYEELEAHHLLD